MQNEQFRFDQSNSSKLNIAILLLINHASQFYSATILIYKGSRLF